MDAELWKGKHEDPRDLDLMRLREQIRVNSGERNLACWVVGLSLGGVGVGVILTALTGQLN
jgi:hypothetical protein